MRKKGGVLFVLYTPPLILMRVCLGLGDAYFRVCSTFHKESMMNRRFIVSVSLGTDVKYSLPVNSRSDGDMQKHCAKWEVDLKKRFS